MPLPPDSIFVSETPESPEDPFGLFPSEHQKTVRVRRRRGVSALGRRFAVLTIASLVRFFAVIVAASRLVVRFAVAACASAVSFLRGLRLPRWRFPAWRLPAWRLPALRLPAWRLPAWRLPAWRLPAWRLPAWRLPASRLPELRLPRWQLPTWRDGASRARIASVISQVRPVVTEIAARTSLSTITVSAFACGVVVGGSAVWLSGASRQATVEPTASQQTAREVPRTAGSPVAPVATAFAETPVVRIAESRTPAAIPAAGTRRPPFRGSLVVNSRPSGARVFVNGRSVGQTPLVLRNQPAGSRAIRVALDGYEPWSSAVQVVADTETRLRAELKVQRAAVQP
jgi:PEGA domain-containing protein